jgi:hypothetical protein
MYFKLGCLCSYGILVMPTVKFLNVVLMLWIKPEPALCSKTEQQLSILSFEP